MTEPVTTPEERMMRWCAYEHLPATLRPVSEPFHDLAKHLISCTVAGPERTVALRKLLEAKDAAVRSVVWPGY